MSRMFTPEPSLPGAPTATIPDAVDATEFEFVLGRRQVASVSLLALTALGVFTTVSYMAGKSAQPVPAPQPAPRVVVPVSPPVAPIAKLPEAPLFATPEKQGLYIQLGSVERGFAVLMVHGARKVGYPAFASGGSNPNVYRVLVGPFDDKAQYETAKAMFISMGLDTFSRKYSESERE